MRIALDTDIGSDVDDLLALAMVLGSPELEVSAVTTVYGDTALRARMVHRAYALAGRSVPPIAAGLRETRSGRAVWWAGHEGALMADLDREPLDGSLQAVALLRASGVVAAIGPLTNVAAALEAPNAVDRLVIMGGDFGVSGEPEHNLKSDVAAAQAVFAAGVPAVVTGIDQTRRVVLAEDHIATIRAAGPLGAMLAAEIQQFRSWLGRANSPHDPVAILALLCPELFTFATGTVRVSDDGVTMLRPDPDGPHRVATDLDTDAVTLELIGRISSAGQG